MEDAVGDVAGDVARDVAIVEEIAVEPIASEFVVVDGGGRSSAFQFNCIMFAKNETDETTVSVSPDIGRLIVVVACADSVGYGIPDITPVLITE